MREYRRKHPGVNSSMQIGMGSSADLALSVTVIEPHHSNDPEKIRVATMWLDEVQLYDLYNLLHHKVQQDGRIINS